MIYFASHAHVSNNCIDRRLELTFDAPTNAGKYVISNNAFARLQARNMRFSLLIGLNDVVR